MARRPATKKKTATGEQKPQNLLRWDLKVDPSRSGEKALPVHYEFRMELDRQMTIGSLTVATPWDKAILPPAPARK